MTLAFGATERPALPRGVRIIEDRVRGGRVLLGPEKAIALDAIGEAILARVDGDLTFAAIVDDLAAAYDAPRALIEKDVQAFLSSLRARMFVTTEPTE